MAKLQIDITDTVEEGNHVTIAYTLLDENGDDITSVDKVEYSIHDGNNLLKEWTIIDTPDLPRGEILIPGIYNRIESSINRYITVHANYDIERRDSFATIRYQLKNTPNTTTLVP